RIPSGFVNNDNKLLTNSYIKLPPSKKNRIYTILVTLKLITNKLIHPKNDFSTDLMALIKQYNHLNYLEDGMGFPANWQSDPVWN
ncbi:Abi family protein, partial [Providencia rustigianii]